MAVESKGKLTRLRLRKLVYHLLIMTENQSHNSLSAIISKIMLVEYKENVCLYINKCIYFKCLWTMFKKLTV